MIILSSIIMKALLAVLFMAITIQYTVGVTHTPSKRPSTTESKKAGTEAYPIRYNQMFKNPEGNTVVFSKDPNFPENPSILKVTTYSRVTNTFAVCASMTATFLSSNSIYMFGDLQTIKSLKTGVIMFNSHGEPPLKLTSIKSNDLSCGTILKPKVLQLSTDRSLDNNYQPNLIIYQGKFLTGSINANDQEGNRGYQEVLFSMTTGEDLGLFRVTSNLPGEDEEWWAREGYSSIQAYDGSAFYSSCHCGSDTELMQNTTGLIIDTGVRINTVAAASGKLFVYDTQGSGYVKVFDTLTGNFLTEFKPRFEINVDECWSCIKVAVNFDASYLYFLADFYSDYFSGHVLLKCSVQRPSEACSFKFYEIVGDNYETFGLTMVTETTLATMFRDYDDDTYKVATFSF